MRTGRFWQRCCLIGWCSLHPGSFRGPSTALFQAAVNLVLCFVSGRQWSRAGLVTGRGTCCPWIRQKRFIGLTTSTSGLSF
ncbi:hypothetical protein GDO81_024302 [Engystomops pustulosus]|uniref:Secreted protein n=1 Tax=Engystomops pustulosus TaxID=76066 RepID=A0AAV6YK36_ENGPU|nr:hypothetical protein GDO81_024302 [Engystomops pustulosus]